MSMAMKHDDLKKLSDNELKKRCDDMAKITVVGLNYFAEEIKRRQQHKFNKLNISISIFSLIVAIVAIVVALIK